MKALLFILLHLFIYPAFAQQWPQSTYPLRYEGRQIVVGSGGGFTGLVKEYYLTDDGYLYSRQGRGASGSAQTFNKLGRKKTVNTKKVFTTLETACKVRTTEFKHPGNLYYFVAWRRGKTEYKVVWGDKDHPAPAEYTRFYKSFMDMIPVSMRL